MEGTCNELFLSSPSKCSEESSLFGHRLSCFTTLSSRWVSDSSSTDDPAYEAKHSYYGQNRWLQYPSSPVGVEVTLNCKDHTNCNFHSGRNLNFKDHTNCNFHSGRHLK
ncbi:uncharacterized protein TNCV_1750851 [Trichonephila clavipes]|nr:uncharacterized protein TNCV_1750851 [Trichonephila clavipes]